MEGNLERAEEVLGDPYALKEIHIEDAFQVFACLAMLLAAQDNDETAANIIALLESLTHHARDAGTGDGSSSAGGSMASLQSAESVVCSSLNAPPRSIPWAL